MAWPTLQTLTDEDVIKKLNSTASGDWGGLGMKLPWTGGSVKPIKVEDFTMINEIWPAGLTPGTTVLFYAEERCIRHLRLLIARMSVRLLSMVISLRREWQPLLHTAIGRGECIVVSWISTDRVLIGILLLSEH